MEELADPFAGSEVASQVAWVAELGSVRGFFDFLGHD
jgi:hypothetical protein